MAESWGMSSGGAFRSIARHKSRSLFGNRKWSGMTPTISAVRPTRETRRPTTSSVPPNCVRQKAAEMSTGVTV